MRAACRPLKGIRCNNSLVFRMVSPLILEGQRQCFVVAVKLKFAACTFRQPSWFRFWKFRAEGGLENASDNTLALWAAVRAPTPRVHQVVGINLPLMPIGTGNTQARSKTFPLSKKSSTRVAHKLRFCRRPFPLE